MTLIKLLKNGFTSFLIRAIAPCLTHGGSLENISTAPPRFVTHTTTPMAYTSRLKKGEVEESVNVICKRNGRTVSGGKIRKRMLYSNMKYTLVLTTIPHALSKRNFVQVRRRGSLHTVKRDRRTYRKQFRQAKAHGNYTLLTRTSRFKEGGCDEPTFSGSL